MNAKFIESAKRNYAQHKDIIDSWAKSTDILEQALADAIYEAVGVTA
jgi:hypothetical protein